MNNYHRVTLTVRRNGDLFAAETTFKASRPYVLRKKVAELVSEISDTPENVTVVIEAISESDYNAIGL
jgi:hypothetical protein